MVTLFNNILAEIDVSQLYSQYLTGNVSDIDTENAIVDAIYANQLDQWKTIATAQSYFVDMLKHSSREIRTDVGNCILPAGVPALEAIEIWVDTGPGNGLISNIMTRGSIASAFSPLFWVFGSTVYIENTINKPDGISVAFDIFPTKTTCSYYLLSKEGQQVLSKCLIDQITGVLSLDSVPGPNCISTASSDKFFYKIDDIISVSGKTLSTTYSAVTRTSVAQKEVEVGGGTRITKIAAKSGGATLQIVNDMFIDISDGLIADKAYLPGVPSTNAVSIEEYSLSLEREKAPFVDWVTTGLNKNIPKSEAFISTFSSALLSGNGIPDDARSDFNSVVSKQELAGILDAIKDELINMEVCNDD